MQGGVTLLEQVTAAVRAAWCRETRDDSDLADWSPGDPARGQRGATALVLHDLLGGDLLLAEVRRTDGSRQGVHWWNRLPGGREVDLTREQFALHEVGGGGGAGRRRPARPARPRGRRRPRAVPRAARRGAGRPRPDHGTDVTRTETGCGSPLRGG
ncbi:YunG family protein [Geodermatophilus sp. SYSU D00663]